MVVLLAYQDRWVDEFASIATSLRQALGPAALRIDHIGSTAVPGLCAKDVIDVQVTVPAFDDGLDAALRDAGFVPRAGVSHDHVPPGFAGAADDWTKRLFTEAPQQRRAHIHVRRAGRPNQRYALLFRDHLRAHPAAAEAYGRLKRALAASLADASAYPEVKDPAVDLVYLAAEAWAAQTHWQPAPPDRAP